MTHKLIALVLLCTALSVSAQAQKPPSKKQARRAPPPPSLVLLPAAGEQLAAAALTYFGGYVCEFDQILQVSLNPRDGGYVDVRFGKQLHTMKPVLSSTGVLRLEDVRGRLLMLQIAMKSMLMDVRVGRRLVDECVHEAQAENRRTAANAPPEPGLGIDPVLTAATAAAQTAAVAASAAASSAESAAATPAVAAPNSTAPAEAPTALPDPALAPPAPPAAVPVEPSAAPTPPAGPPEAS